MSDEKKPTTRVHAVLSAEDNERLDQSAKLARRSKTRHVEQIIVDHLDREEQEAKESDR